jgi:acetylornithine deacetylase/succinyl-diaminopimelate desuccinylase-like protein
MLPAQDVLDRMQSGMREHVPLASVTVETLCDYPGNILQAHTDDEYIEDDQLLRAERFLQRIGDSLAR